MTLLSILDGPRGRRLLFELAIDLSRAAHGGGYPDWPAGALLWRAQYQFDPNRDRIVFFGATIDDSSDGGSDDIDIAAPHEQATPERLANALANDLSISLAPDVVREALVESVESARYWQECDGRDMLADTDAIRQLLGRVLAILDESGLASWWSGLLDIDAQVVVTMLEDQSRAVSADEKNGSTRSRAAEVAQWSSRTTENEAKFAAEWVASPGRSMSGSWWSAPAFIATATTGTVDQWASPVGLWAVEDGMGWKKAQVASAVIQPNPRVFEITSAPAWAELCSRYPIDVTSLKRHDWRLTTGRDGAWVMPDWTAVAVDYDAVHLTVLAYLSAAGTAIPVGDNAASVIAGWSPDETYWLTDTVFVETTFKSWIRTQEEGWRRVT